MTVQFIVYALVENGVTVYVGYTRDPQERLKSHRANRVCSRDAKMKTLGRYKSIESARLHETRWIEKLRPERNKRDNRMPSPEARKIWYSHLDLTNKQIIKRMPGWTINSAHYAFGGRLNECDFNSRRNAA